MENKSEIHALTQIILSSVAPTPKGKSGRWLYATPFAGKGGAWLAKPWAVAARLQLGVKPEDVFVLGGSKSRPRFRADLLSAVLLNEAAGKPRRARRGAVSAPTPRSTSSAAPRPPCRRWWVASQWVDLRRLQPGLTNQPNKA